MSKVNERVLYSKSWSDEVKKQIKARNWAMPYINPCGREIVKISLYTQNQMSSHLDKLREEIKKYLENIHNKDKSS